MHRNFATFVQRGKILPKLASSCSFDDTGYSTEIAKEAGSLHQVIPPAGRVDEYSHSHKKQVSVSHKLYYKDYVYKYDLTSRYEVNNKI